MYGAVALAEPTIKHVSDLEELITSSDRRFDTSSVYVLEGCQLVIVSDEHGDCKVGTEARRRLISVDLNRLRFRERYEAWDKVEIVFGDNRKDIGRVVTLPFSKAGKDVAEIVAKVARVVETRNYRHHNYCGSGDTVRHRAGGQYNYVKGGAASRFEDVVLRERELCRQ